MEILTETQQGKTIGKLKGRMDTLTTKNFDQWFSEWMQQGQKELVLDMSGLSYISSSGLRSLLSAAKQIRSSQGTLALFGLTGVVRQVFQLSGFFSIFQVFDSLEDAIKAAG